MDCPHCQQRQSGGYTGVFYAGCVTCCAHKVYACKPDRQRAAAMLAFLTDAPRVPRPYKPPPRNLILDAVKELAAEDKAQTSTTL